MIKKFFVLIIFISSFYLVNHVEHNYSIEGIVINESTVKDVTGNKWTVSYIPYRDNAKVKIYFNDNYTNTRKDDIIKKIIIDK